MKTKFIALIISSCLLLLGCSNPSTHDKINSTHPHIRGIVKQQGRAVSNVPITLSAANCDTATTLTNTEGQFDLEQYCPIATSAIAVLGATADVTTLFDITISNANKVFIWSVIDPYDIKVEFDLSEQMVCQTTSNETHCTHLILQDDNVNVTH